MQLIVTLTMPTKVFNLIDRDGLILAGALITRFILRMIGSESTTRNLPCLNSSDGIDNDGQKGVFIQLMGGLFRHVNSAEPAIITRIMWNNAFVATVRPSIRNTVLQHCEHAIYNFQLHVY